MKKIYAFIFLSLVSLKLFSQENEKRNCGTNDYMHQLEHEYPEVITNRQQIEQHVQQFIKNAPKNKRTIITIPVVVHVVYNLATQNISDAQINSQIDVLNKDFRKLNTDFVNTPGSFQPLAADCQIEFVLARRAPNGDSTNGITRTQTAVTSFTSNNNVKRTVNGGKDPWPAADYLNIWVCKLSGGLLGYGQFPGGPAATDGVVISFKAFGTMGTALAPFNKGRTATHEIGHWLNLYHIWGDDGGSCNGTDLVEDTPNQGAENTGMPVYPKISCNNTPFGDMFMNYMDYTNDAGMTMFSLGQKSRMDAMFVAGGPRFSITNSLGGQYPVPPISCGVPANGEATGISVTNAQIQWSNTPDATAYNLLYKKTSDSLWITVSVPVNTAFLNNLSSNTSYDFKLQANCPVGLSNFSTTYNFTTLPQPVLICTDNYESNNNLTTAINIPRDSMTCSMISNSSDNDYYRVEISEQMKNVRISLSNLPQDYDVYLYTIRGTLIKTSQAGGLNAEEIVQNSNYNGPQTYYVRVKGYNGAYSNASCYSLNIETSATAFRENVLSPSEIKPEIVMYPVPAVNNVTASVYYEGNRDIQCNLYNSFGHKIDARQITTQKGLNEITFQTQSLASGVYLLEVIDSDERRIQKFNVSK